MNWRKRPVEIVLLVLAISSVSNVRAQNMPHEIGLWFASGGQVALNKSDNNNPGFFESPTIVRGYFSFLSNGVQSLSVTLENDNETRTRTGIWSDIFLGGAQSNYPAVISENLHITTLGLETIRTLISESGFRLGAGIGLGYGFGRTKAEVVKRSNGEKMSTESCNPWQGFMVDATVKFRYTVYSNGSYEVGIMAAGRAWGFPYIGPIAECSDMYNGPSIRTLSQLGYLAGLSVGF